MKRRSHQAYAPSVSPTMPEVSPYTIFLSHASQDKWIAETICEKIEQNAAPSRTWIDDRDINGGDRIPDTIKKSIEACHEFVVLLTPASIQRPWVTVEIGAAWGMGKRIVPLFYHTTPSDIVDVIKDVRGYHLNELSKYLSDLKRRAAGANP